MISSSGIKRGLAMSAVSALAITGLGTLAGPASAISITENVTATQGANSVQLFAPFSGLVSPRNDGANTSIHLLAGGGSNVDQVRFEYQNFFGGAPVVLGQVSRTNGVFTYEWTPAAGQLGFFGSVTAVGLNAFGTTISNDAANVQYLGVEDSVDIANAPGSNVGVFEQPYAGENETGTLGVINGTTSGTAVNVSSLSPNGTGAGPATVGTPNANGISAWRGTVDFGAYPFDTTAPIVDQAIVGAQSQTDDAEVVSLSKQVITGVAATATPANVPNGQNSTVTVKVVDAAGAPIAGAQVARDDDNDGVADGAFVYTDEDGEATFSLPGSAQGTTYGFYVNTTDDDAYQGAIDFRRTVTVTSYTAVATTVTSASNDGNAFDQDEYQIGDLTTRVTDQNTNGLAGQTVSYRLSVVPFDSATAAPAPVTGTVVTGADGEADLPFQQSAFATDGTYTLSTYVERDGSPGQTAGDLSAANRTFKSGNATLEFNDGSTVNAASGSTKVVSATLALADGTPLAGRDVQFSYTASGNSVIAAQANQPSGTTRNNDQVANGTTNANGVVSVALTDPATPNQGELDSVLDAETTNTPNIGDAGADDSIDVDFASSSAPAGTQIAVTINSNQGAGSKPGTAQGGTINVKGDTDNDASTPIANVAGLAVTLKVDHGFFTDGSADPAATAGNDAGELKSLGNTITVVTDGNGNATFQTAIERDAGFDDDGQVTAVVTATAGSATASDSQYWDSSDPLNGGTVTISQSPASDQDVSVLPKAPVDKSVYYDVFATDQFGNLTDADVTVSSDLAAGSVNGGTSDTVQAGYTNDGPEVQLNSSAAGNQTPTATWTAKTLKFAGNPLTPTAGTETLTDTGETINWYVVNFATGKYTLTTDRTGTQPVGQTVIVTYTALDQNGEPIEGAEVSFFRSGPDTLQDGTPAGFNGVTFTGADGKATYVFSGATAGTATIQALITDADGVGGSDNQPVGSSRATTTVVFSNTPTGPTGPTNPVQAVINAVLDGSSKGAKDVVKVDAGSKAAGAKATLYKKVNGELKRLKVKTLNSAGQTKFSVRDRNGNKVTKYVVVVDQTSTSQADRSKTRIK